MFTGLIQDVGIVRGLTPAGEAVRIEISTRLSNRLNEGDSLAVNGVCLTVTAFGEGRVVATAVAETLDRTELGRLRQGTPVNLEPALRAGDPMGGHIVQGHVDGTGVVSAVRPRGVSQEIVVDAPPDILRYNVEKGSVAIDGISLTVAAITDHGFSVAVIPHTLQSTTLHQRHAGDRVHLEVDVLAKYVEKMLRSASAGEGVTEAFLRRHGFA